VKHKPHWGATPEDWQRLIDLGLGCDLLPVVSNPGAKISPRSAIKAIGKTPSLYNNAGEVVGISQWTSHQASDAELQRWMAQPDYGICVQTRLDRGLDVDVANQAVADAIVAAVFKFLGRRLPRRWRSNSGKCLLRFRMPGDFSKRIMHVEGGLIEFLANGQQFIAYGTHTSGERYQWDDEDRAQELSPEEFEALWSHLADQFAIEPPRETHHTERKRGAHLDVPDPVADYLEANGLALDEDSRGAIMVECPWQDEHSGGEAGDSSTVWFRAGTNGHSTGHFKCLHAHCSHRTRQDYLVAVGYEEDVSNDFEDLGPGPDAESSDPQFEPGDSSQPRTGYSLIQAAAFADQPSGEWLVKGLIPKEELVIVYGASGAGKSFVMIDLCMAIARGLAWRNCRVKQGKIIYIAAEGGGGVRKRLKAYAIHHGINLADVPFYVLHASPNLLDKAQVKLLIAAIEAEGDVAMIVCDTFAQMTAGANENAAEDMGLAIAHIRAVGRRSGATTVLVHHAGKDATKGARGWSGLKAAADAEVEVTRDGDDRAINTTKQKDADDGASWGFRLETVPIGMDDDGDVVESCVIVESDVQVEAGVRGGGRGAASKVKFGPWEQAVLDTYAELAVGGDVLKSELVMTTADKMTAP
jgi:KaiC/GvpD/RAD55 family RecA-like ATPase